MTIARNELPASPFISFPEEIGVSEVRPHTEASEVAAEAGLVLIDGPGSTAISMTPDAAEETARRLVEAAAEARRQDGAWEPDEI